MGGNTAPEFGVCTGDNDFRRWVTTNSSILRLSPFGKREVRGEVACQEAQATFARMAAAQLSVVQQVKLAYYELCFVDRAIAVDKELEGRITFQQLIENYKTLLRHRIEYHRRLAQRAQAIATLERAVGCAITTWPIDPEVVPAEEDDRE